MQNYTLLERFMFSSVTLNPFKMIDELNGKTVLITGASSGIGKELAYLLADADVHLILVARREEELRLITEEIEKGSAKATVFPADLRNTQQMAELLEFLHRLPEGLDIVVSNAGLSINRPIVHSLDRLHDFTRTMAINYFAPVQLLLSVIPLLAAKKGHIINVSTINALLLPIPYWAAYQASKTAFDTWLRSAAPELNSRGISTTTLYLPLVRTPMIEPTIAYRTAPAMSPVTVAELIGHSMYSKRKTYKPWWLIFGQLGSVTFRKPLEFIIYHTLKQKEPKKNGV
ncbi:SDR family NAD(P)-dependent oxidoreductase [Planococcus shixiaomingii]|uniref:SDR family NAD(P)-dependent oxidoreductase n=1 Tax=Planococcus shixiaomingii TaxID=3058393 RepID=UPI0026189FF6|nr:SDR family NAD(P)-dependent oxidoreductase [Planococcus sp. N022]WKA56603.1 SDR family NAD(P)-dependent oxidoreductase [Planococcus sp. N022]